MLETYRWLEQHVRGDKNEMMKSQHRHPFPDSPSESERNEGFLLLLLFHLLAPTPTTPTAAAKATEAAEAAGALIKLPERS